MIAIAKEMISGFRYLFPRGKFRIVLIALSALAATISVSELLVMKFFATLVLNEEEFTREFLGWAIAGFFSLLYSDQGKSIFPKKLSSQSLR